MIGIAGGFVTIGVFDRAAAIIKERFGYYLPRENITVLSPRREFGRPYPEERELMHRRADACASLR